MLLLISLLFGPTFFQIFHIFWPPAEHPYHFLHGTLAHNGPTFSLWLLRLAPLLNQYLVYYMILNILMQSEAHRDTWKLRVPIFPRFWLSSINIIAIQVSGKYSKSYNKPPILMTLEFQWPSQKGVNANYQVQLPHFYYHTLILTLPINLIMFIVAVGLILFIYSLIFGTNRQNLLRVYFRLYFLCTAINDSLDGCSLHLIWLFTGVEAVVGHITVSKKHNNGCGKQITSCCILCVYMLNI